MPETPLKEPHYCPWCMERPWRVAFYFSDRSPEWVCADCLVVRHEMLPEAMLYIVRTSSERRTMFGGYLPLVEWLMPAYSPRAKRVAQALTTVVHVPPIWSDDDARR